MASKLNRIMMASATALTLGLSSGLAHAGPISFFGGENLVTDRDAEQFIDTNNNGIIDAGDRFRGIIEISKTEQGANTNYFSGSTNELTGLFDLTVTASAVVNANLVTISYAPTAGLAAEAAGFANVPYTAAQLAGTAGVLFQDPAVNFARASCTIAACTGTAIDGTFVGALGFNGDADQLIAETIPFLLGGATLNFASIVAGLPQPGTNSNAVTYLQLNWLQYSSSVFPAGPGLVTANFAGVGGDGLIGFNGSTTVTKPASGSPFDLYSQTIGSLNKIPEPGELSLMGLGLVALGAFGLRRKRADLAKLGC